MLVFCIASAGCAFAPQGIGAALMLPVSAAIVLGAFGAASAGMAMAIYTGRLLANRAITADFTLAFMIQFTTLAAILFGAMYLQDVLKVGPLAAGGRVSPARRSPAR